MIDAFATHLATFTVHGTTYRFATHATSDDNAYAQACDVAADVAAEIGMSLRDDFELDNLVSFAAPIGST